MGVIQNSTNLTINIELFRVFVMAFLEEGLAGTVQSSHVLVVGTGGIGCELLKNLVLTGFQKISAVSTFFHI